MTDHVERTPFGQLSSGQEATLYTLRGQNGAWASVTDFGASLVGFGGPGHVGHGIDIVLSYNSATELEHNPFYIGALVGRIAGRIGCARFELDGKQHVLTANTPPHHLHGGTTGLGQREWTAERALAPDPSIRFVILSPAGDEGYPGTVSASVTYTLLPPAKLVVEIEATSTAPTPFNPTSHAYFNLNGHDAGSIADHELQIFANRYTSTDADRIPTGEILSVDGMTCDFRMASRIGRNLDAMPTGFDQNYLINDADGSLRKAAIVRSPASGHRLTVWTDRPCIHLYTGHFLDVPRGKGGASYGPASGFALEAQGFPDAVNHTTFPADILRPGDVFCSRTIFELDQDIRT